ncbi:hypothetical protein [Eubacterium sp. 1001713B170207_170306_E7]|uniref:hypothetical protein n=1 Tax=Eubacterium sp. 1001713B170207_170306_E7 TaxID=2787097 RepID=UPI00189AB93D|nr:hypothetical protein [Eubacterium sp. 1001713B170207_170306_E7]
MRLKTGLLLLLLIFVCPPLCRAQAQSPAPDAVATAEALSQWLESHQDTGGSLRLEADIEWNGYQSVQAGAPVTIDAGPYRIHLNHRSYLGLAGPVTVEGAPLPGNALFDTEAVSQLSLDDGAAVSVQGDGTVAVRTRWDQGFVSYAGTVRAAGAGATAIEVLDGTLSFSYARISAEGDNAACVDATRGSADILFSILEADGSGSASLRSGPDAVVDASRCQPAPENAVVIPASRHGLSISTGSGGYLYHRSILDKAPLPRRINLVFGPAGGLPERCLPLYWTPDTHALPGVPGRYSVSGSLDLPGDFAQLLEGFQPVLDVQLVDPARPYLMPMYRYSSSGVYAIGYFETLYAHDHHEALYISQDLGKSWHYTPPGDDTADSFITYNHLSLQFKNYFEPGQTYLLKMEAESPDISGVSNILELYLSPDGELRIDDFNGDRDFSDRGDNVVTPTPALPDSPPDTVSEAADPPVTYSHSQLLDLAAANPETLTFFGSGIQASVSSQALTAAVSGENDTLTVYCTPLGGGRYQIAFIKNGTEAAAFSAAPLRVRINCRLRENETPDQLSFKTGDGAAASIVSYDEKTSQLELLVTAPGIYTLSSTWTEPSAPPAPAEPGLAGELTTVALLALAAAVLVLLHRRSKKRSAS